MGETTQQVWEVIFSVAEFTGGLLREETGNINRARVSKKLDIRLRCFNLFLGNRESTEVLNQRNSMISVPPTPQKKTEEL